MPSNITRADVVTEARTWLGTPFLHQGFHRSIGCDCIGLIKGLSMALQLTDFDPDSPEAKLFNGYRRSPDPTRMRAGIGRWLRPIKPAEAMLADVLYMAWNAEPQHVALVTDIGIIHSFSFAGKVVEHRMDRQWTDRIRDAWRFPVFMEEQ
jgi:NlpC/P60 family putative phage cell wall peptidase